MWANVYSGDDIDVWIDGEQFSGSGTAVLGQFAFDDYDSARDQGIVIETRTKDGTLLDRCTVYAGACGDECTPSRETVGICTNPDGTITLNEWDCPCDNGIADYSCQGACSITGPQ